MRNNNQQKRMRGRNNNRRSQNPLTRVYESNGPDVKVRGTAHHIAEKYQQLARDAQASGDHVAAENYLQHAEHYYRIIAAAQAQFGVQGQPFQRPDEDEDDFELDETGASGNQGFGQNGENQPYQQNARDNGHGRENREFQSREQSGQREGGRDGQPRRDRDNRDNRDRDNRDRDNRDRAPRENREGGDQPREFRDREPRENRWQRNRAQREQTEAADSAYRDPAQQPQPVLGPQPAFASENSDIGLPAFITQGGATTAGATTPSAPPPAPAAPATRAPSRGRGAAAAAAAAAAAPEPVAAAPEPVVAVEPATAEPAEASDGDAKPRATRRRRYRRADKTEDGATPEAAPAEVGE